MAAEHLTIVVPYRDRPQHLDLFLSHVCAFFSRAVSDVETGLDILIVDQGNAAPFNGGLLKNIGFDLARARCTQICFHDVDYLPIWVDYSKPKGLTPLVWYGAERRPLVPGGTLVIEQRLENFFGGAVLIPARDFEVANGYANDYWGWGFEDIDLLARCICSGITIDRRKGTFHPLNHASEGFRADGQPSEAHLSNQRLYQSRWPRALARDTIDRAASRMDQDGLSALRFTVSHRRTLPSPITNDRGIPIALFTVDFVGPAGRRTPAIR
jgi:hypothetical protein